MRAPDSDLPIAFEGVTVAAGGTTILDRISLTIDEGPPTVIIGPNGAGKTTLLRVAMGLQATTQGIVTGSVTWGGRPDVPPLRRAFMFQRPVMLRRSVSGNLAYSMDTAGLTRNERSARIAETLSLVGLGHLADRPARRLSGGEQQRLALARALVRDPRILFLDEPTASLDPAAAKAVEDAIRATSARGIKVVMSTHDIAAARRLAGTIVMIHRGRVIEAGVAPAFFSRPQTGEARAFLAGDLLL